MIFKIWLPQLGDLLNGLEEDDETREDQERTIRIPVKMPPNWSCSCLCSVLNVNTTWNLNYNPFIIY
jgi:hypothetical protein